MIKTGFELPLVVTEEDANAHETLVYSRGSGFSWVRQARNDEATWPTERFNWKTKASTVVEALAAARAAGFNPTAVYYTP